MIGAKWDDDKGENSGSAYIFERNHGGNNNWGEVKKLIDPDGVVNGWFGYSVAILGNTVLIGAPNLNDRGSVYVYQ